VKLSRLVDGQGDPSGRRDRVSRLRTCPYGTGLDSAVTIAGSDARDLGSTLVLADHYGVSHHLSRHAVGPSLMRLIR